MAKRFSSCGSRHSPRTCSVPPPRGRSHPTGPAGKSLGLPSPLLLWGALCPSLFSEVAPGSPPRRSHTRPGPICPGGHKGGSPNHSHITTQLPTQDQPQRPREMSHPQATCLCAQLGAAWTQSSGFTSPSPTGTPTARRPFTWIWAEAISSPRKEKKLGAIGPREGR